MLYSLFRPALFRIDAEKAHGLALSALKVAPPRRVPSPSPLLASEVAGIRFPSPVGMAAGFDKDGKTLKDLLKEKLSS